jgi:hypothetical protein
MKTIQYVPFTLYQASLKRQVNWRDLNCVHQELMAVFECSNAALVCQATHCYWRWFMKTVEQHVEYFHDGRLDWLTNSSMVFAVGSGKRLLADSSEPYTAQSIRNCRSEISPVSSNLRKVALGTPLL